METKHDKKAIIKKTGKEIMVYKHISGGWVNSNDLETIYKPEEIQLK